MLASMLGLAVLAGGCAPSEDPGEDEATASAATSGPGPSDPAASPGTRTVLANLHGFDLGSPDAAEHHVLFGQQEADVSNREVSGLVRVDSDVEKRTGRSPALVGYELSHADANATTMFDRARFREGLAILRERILEQRRRGILVTLVWHLRCPKKEGDRDLFGPDDCPSDYVLDEFLEDKGGSVPGVHFAEWRGMLDELATFLASLKDDRGELIPVQLRPFHEHTGDWFWWGQQNSPTVYATVWREMVSYLRARGIHHVLWVYCPAQPSDRSFFARFGFESYYPGDAFVDVIAFDRYDFGQRNFKDIYENDLDVISAFAREHGKVAAVAEIGRRLDVDDISPDPTWFTKTLLQPLLGRSFAYAALWRNAPWEKFVPDPDDASIHDFVAMSRDPVMLFAGPRDLYRRW